MLIYSGIDEAGYGPLMGPLCVACSSWELPGFNDPAAPPDMWKLLSPAVCRKAKDRRGRVAIADSKKLKKPNAAKAQRKSDDHHLHALERGVLACLGAPSQAVNHNNDGDLFSHLGSPHDDRAAPWYSGSVQLPVACDRESIAIGSLMLRRAMSKANIASISVACARADAEEINNAATIGAVKSTVPWGMLMGHVRAITTRFPDASHRIAADRQGGRMRYLTDLMREFPGDQMTIVREDETESTYRIESGTRTIVISFTVGGETTHLPIALASMTAKYIRELWMIRLNRWFSTRVEGLAPTAGYVQDGRRFLACIRPALAKESLPETMLIRAI